MMRNCLLILLFGCVLHVASLCAQVLEHRQGSYIMCFHPGADRSETEGRHADFNGTPTAFRIQKCLSDRMNIWAASFDHTSVHEGEFMEALAADPDVAIIQYNHFLSKRSQVPNDPLLADQWFWINLGQAGTADADIDADDAWSITTGGTTRVGDTIVVASLDVGVNYQHPDLVSNIWMNRHEIPGNGIDDDANGYQDDVRGWNVLLENDNIEPEIFGGGVMESHGTEILGVIGAVGNNGIGVSGINWHVQMMNVYFNSDLNEADMIGAYGYVLDQRMIYNETNGEQGAFVVATNLSYGDEDITPTDAPIWCAVYDSLGAVGIVSCVATSNSNIDIDTVKDVPTSCASEYMISVTATDASDQRVFAAYGQNDVDLAAPGEGLLTTDIEGYSRVRGTSYSSPMVAGAIALLYASPCPDLAALAATDPSAAALQARDLILQNVDKLAGLAAEVRTGGRLNVFNSLKGALSACQTCVPAFSIEANAAIDSAVITWAQADSVTRTALSYRLSGDTLWQQVDSVQSPLTLTGLQPCSSYDFALLTFCQDSTSSASDTLAFDVAGCCANVSTLDVLVLDDTSARVLWQAAMLTEGYLIRYSSTDSIVWDSVFISTVGAGLTGLTACTDYVLQIQTLCDTGATAFGDTVLFTTLGCNTCQDLDYCPVNAEGMDQEWIDSFAMHTIANASGNDGGYGDYTDQCTELEQGMSYAVSFTPGFVGDSLLEPVGYYAWIDYDQDGTFDSGAELVFQSDSASTASSYTGRIEVPEDAMLGSTRLRVLMMASPPDSVPGCNLTVAFGEVEDYCLNIVIDSLLCPVPEDLDTINFAGTSTEVTWGRVDSAVAYVIRHRKVGDGDWEEMVDTSNKIALMELDECSEYEVQVQAVCHFDTSSFTESLIVKTFCSTGIEELLAVSEFTAYPNPFVDWLAASITVERRIDGLLRVYDLGGRLVSTQDVGLPPGRNQLSVQGASKLRPGMYLVSLDTPDGSILRKVLKH